MLTQQTLWILVVGLPLASSLYNCYDGFVGRIRYPKDGGFRDINETRMCAAKWCIRVTLYDALDREGIYREGISTRCAYTGGDRSLCQTNNCTHLQYYNGMRGKFKFCCCEGNSCNAVNGSDSSFLRVYAEKALNNEDKTNGIGALRPTIALSLVAFYCLIFVVEFLLHNVSLRSDYDQQQDDRGSNPCLNSSLLLIPTRSYEHRK